jgi:SpoVK/Ycf46/Vps4 family AAA+-type ATPase
MESSLQPLPLQPWAREFARRWNSEAYTLFLLHGNIFDIYPVRAENGIEYVPLKAFLKRRLFPTRDFLMFYDIGDGLTFATKDMQKRFFTWLKYYDDVEKTNYAAMGTPREFPRLSPILRRFFQREPDAEIGFGATLVIDFPEKIIPSSEDYSSSYDERTAVVTLLKWATSPELRHKDVGIALVTESPSKLQADLLQNPHVAQIKIELPDQAERLRYLQSLTCQQLMDKAPEPVAAEPALPSTALPAPIPAPNPVQSLAAPAASLTPEELSQRTAGLNILRLQNVIAEAVKNGQPVTQDHVSRSKKILIEEFCQGLVKFKDPKPGLNLDSVATHRAAKKKLREIAWLFKNNKTDVIERGILLPGRVGVGKSFLVDCFASECNLPVMEIGDFRSKWVGDTERQQSRILMTIRALGPVIVVVDEADAVFGTRSAGGDDGGISGRVFAAFAAHIGDSTLRGRELWIAMTSRPDLLTIDLKRQGRFGLCVPLFPAQDANDIVDLFQTVARVKKIQLSTEIEDYIRANLATRPLTGSDVDSIITRAKEIAVLAQRDTDIRVSDLQEAIGSFIDALDPDLIALQELAAVLACSDARYLPEKYKTADRAEMTRVFNVLRGKLR